MKKNLWVSLLGVLLVAAFVLLMVMITVRQGEAVVITTFGNPTRTIVEPGLYFRWPKPIQGVQVFDNRVHILDGSFEETLTKDEKNVIVAFYAGWKIFDPELFREKMGTEEAAESNINSLLSNYKNSVIGLYSFGELVNIDQEKLRFDEIEQDILTEVQAAAKTQYGIDVVFVGIRRIGLPETITEKVFDRMRAERNEIAESYRSEGEGEAIRIRAEADSKRDQLLAEADGAAKRIRAEGDAAAIEYYTVFEQSPELAIFLRKLEVLEETLKTNSTVILGPTWQPYELLRGEGLPVGKPEEAK